MPEFFCEFWENKNVKPQKAPFILWNKKSNNIVYSQQQKGQVQNFLNFGKWVELQQEYEYLVVKAEYS